MGEAEPPTKRLQRAVTGRLRRWDTRLAQQDGVLPRADGSTTGSSIDRNGGSAAAGPGAGGGAAAAGGRRGLLVRTETRGRLRRFTTQRLPVGADQSESAPSVVIARGDVGAAAAADELGWTRRLIAPISGMIAGAIEISALWPTEWAKVQRQLPGRAADFSVLAEMRAQGFGIYRGLTPMLIGAPLQCAVRFGMLDTCKAALAGGDGKNAGRATALAAGMCAGVAEAVLVVTPMETVKTRLVDTHTGLLAGVRQFYAAEGLAGIYKGLGATIAKSASNQMLRFFIFNEYKRFVVGDENPLAELTPVEALFGGMTAGCLGCLGNTPFDVLKTRMQGMDAGRYTSTLHCASTVLREEGPRGLYNGLSARLCRVVPGQGLIFMSYESISQFVRKALEQHEAQ